MIYKKKEIKNFWKKVRFKYKLTLLNENTFEEVFSFKMSQLSAFIITVFISLLFISLVVIVIVGTPLKTYLPGYLDSDVRMELVSMQMRLDSIVEQNNLRMKYIDNVKSILTGDISADSIAPIDSMIINARRDSLLQKSFLEQQFVESFELEEKYNLSVFFEQQTPGAAFFTPVRGVLVEKFNKEEKSLGVIVLCARNAHISTPLDGVVIFSGYTIDNGYVVQIQHSNEYISLFRNLESVFVNKGTSLTSGAVIGTPKTDRSRDNKPLLYYELWHKGSAVNPEYYIKF